MKKLAVGFIACLIVTGIAIFSPAGIYAGGCSGCNSPFTSAGQGCWITVSTPTGYWGCAWDLDNCETSISPNGTVSYNIISKQWAYGSACNAN